MEEEDERRGDGDVRDCRERVGGFGEPVDCWDEEPGAEVYAVWVGVKWRKVRVGAVELGWRKGFGGGGGV